MNLFFKTLVIIFGCGATTNQIVFLREFFVSSGGNELFFAIIFGVWLLGVTCGGMIGGTTVTAQKKTADNNFSSFYLVLSLLIIQAILAPILIILIRSIRTITGIPAGEPFSLSTFIMSSFILIIPFSFLVGFLFPKICGLREVFVMKNVSEKEQDFYTDKTVCATMKNHNIKTESIGLIYTLESFGSAIGGFLISIFLIGRISSIAISIIIFLITMLNIVLLLTIYPKNIISNGNKNLLSKSLFYISIIATILLFIFLFTSYGKILDEYTLRLRWKAFGKGMKLVESKDTPYQHLSLALQSEQYSLFSNGEFVTAFPDPYDAAMRGNFIMCEHPLPKNILIIGSGDEEIISWMLKYNPETITYIDSDPYLHPFLINYLPKEIKDNMKDKRVKIIHTDGRLYIKNLSAKFIKSENINNTKKLNRFDIVVLSLPEPSTISYNRFYTVEFYQEVSNILSDNGVLITSISSAVNYFGETVLTYAGSIFKSLTTVYPEILISPGIKAYVIASKKKGTASFDSEILGKRYSSKLPDNEYFTQYNFMTMFEPYQVKFTQNSFDNLSKKIPVNKDLYPISHLFNLILWSKMTGTKGEHFLKAIQNLNTIFISLFLFIPVVAILLFSYFLSVRGFNKAFPKKEINRLSFLKSSVIIIIITTGFFMMAGEIIILYVYQKDFGNLYQKIGLLVSMMMFGLAIGGQISTKYHIKDIKTGYIHLFITELSIIAVLILSILFLLGEAKITRILGISCLEFIYFALLTIYGILGGIQFPMVGQMIKTIRGCNEEYKSESTKKAAGIVEFADHLGAATGALITGIVLIPSIGIIKTLSIIILLKIFSLAILGAGKTIKP